MRGEKQMIKVCVSNGMDSVVSEFQTRAEVDAYLEQGASIDKRALKALATQVPVAVEVVKPTVVAVETPAQPKERQTTPAETCPSCNHQSLYLNTVKKEGKNKGRKFKSCKGCNYFAWA